MSLQPGTKRTWRERFLHRIVDRKRVLALVPRSTGPSRLIDSCQALLSSRGAGSDSALSQGILTAYSHLDREGRGAFFKALTREFGPEPEAVRAAAEEFLASGSPGAIRRLSDVMVSPRPELFRRLSMAPNGTAALVSMRADLLGLKGEDEDLNAVDADLRRLLASWFHPAFLRLERIDWNSPASLLEQLISHDRVQRISGWYDLRRRLAPDRRCYAYFHPALPAAPLVFVEVALTRGMTRESRALVDETAPALEPRAADTAMFYSINNTQAGLRGLSLGNHLIKKALETLQRDLPNLEVFATLSPMPRFAATVKAAARNEIPGVTRDHLDAMLADFAGPLRSATDVRRPIDALLGLLEDVHRAPREILAGPLKRLALVYFGVLSDASKRLDPVAGFHLSNGAQLAQVNPFADMSAQRVRESYGVMVNYRYLPGDLADNREKFLRDRDIAVSAPLSRALQKLRPIWAKTPAAA